MQLSDERYRFVDLNLGSLKWVDVKYEQPNHGLIAMEGYTSGWRILLWEYLPCAVSAEDMDMPLLYLPDRNVGCANLRLMSDDGVDELGRETIVMRWMMHDDPNLLPALRGMAGLDN